MKRWQTWALVVVLGCTMILYGCVSEGTKGCNDQNRQAGALIQKDPAAAPETIQAGCDVEANSVAMAKEIGQPKQSLPYTPQNSADLRKQIPENPWWKRALNNIWTLLGAFVMGGGAMRLASTFVPALAPFGTMAQTLITAIAKGREKAEVVADGPGALKALLTTMESELVDVGLQGKVKAMAKKVENALDIEHKVTLR
jgi:hypothetical protein